MNIFEYIISGIAPHSCVQCGAEGVLLCLGCTQSLPATQNCCYVCALPRKSGRTCANCQPTSPLSAVIAATAYAEMAKHLLYALKYDRVSAAATDVAGAIAYCLPRNGLPDDLVVTHVPTAQSRVRQRGYDQSALIAKNVASLIGRPYAPLLQRVSEQRQVGQKREIRKRQMIAAFRAIHLPLFADRSVMLIDDVITTGSTLVSAAQTLRQAGASDIKAAVFARA